VLSVVKLIMDDISDSLNDYNDAEKTEMLISVLIRWWCHWWR